MALEDKSHTGITEGQWISLKGFPDDTLLLRREFDLADRPDAAPLTVTAMGYFELYVNGQRVGDHVLDPPSSNYSKRVFSVTHDIHTYTFIY